MRLLRSEGGFALPLALATMAATGAMVVTVVEFSSSSGRTANVAKGRLSAEALAEAAINSALAVLANPANNALDPATLPSSEASANQTTYDGGTSKWWGTLSGSTWTLYGVGTVANPTGGAALERRLTATSQLRQSFSATPNTVGFNVLYAKKTGDADGCDQAFTWGAVDLPVYARGHICLSGWAWLIEGPVSTLGQVKQLSTGWVWTSVGLSWSWVSELLAAGGCKYRSQALRNPCVNGAASGGDNVWASTITNTPPDIPAPTADFAGWYANTNVINHVSDCNVLSGTPPTFDGDTTRNSSVGTVQNLTPTSSYTCRKLVGGSPVAEFSWNSSTRTFTIQGVTYIDGSARIDNEQLNVYDGSGSLYLSGTLKFGVSGGSWTRLCAAASGGYCDQSNWNPNTELFVIVADGQGGQNSSGNGIQVERGNIQAALYATHAIYVGSLSWSQGPMTANEVKFGGTWSSMPKNFPFVTTAPAGMPTGNTVVAQPGPPVYGS